MEIDFYGEIPIKAKYQPSVGLCADVFSCEEAVFVIN